MKMPGNTLMWFVFSVIVGVTGFAAPRFFIDNGIYSYSNEVERRVAINSINAAQRAFRLSFDRPLITAYQITDVHIAAETCDDPPNMNLPEGGYASRLQTYTIFGLRYKTFHMGCGGDGWPVEVSRAYDTSKELNY